MSRKDDAVFRHFVRQLEQAQNQKQTLGTSHIPNPKYIVERRRYGTSRWEIHSSHHSLKKAQESSINTSTHEYRLRDD